MFRDGDMDGDVEVSPALVPDMRKAFSTEPEDGPGLSARRNLESQATLRSRYLDNASQSCFAKGDGHGHIDVALVSPEILVRFDRDVEIEISRGAAAQAWCSLSRYPNSGPTFYTSRHMNVDSAVQDSDGCTETMVSLEKVEGQFVFNVLPTSLPSSSPPRPTAEKVRQHIVKDA